MRVYRINRDFTPGEEVQQPSPIDAGIYAHQVRTTPDNRLAILVTRSNPATATKAGDPGALKVFDYRNGLLTKEVSIAPNGGKDFGPRHLDYHPFKPWMYVSIETQNKMFTYLIEGGRINSEIAFREETWAEPNNIRARQAAGTVHVHPNGRFLYGANRALATVEFQGKQVFKGRENSIVVFAIGSIHRRADANPAHRDPKDPPTHLSHRPERTHTSRRAQSAGQCAERRCHNDSTGRPIGVPHRRRRNADLRAQIQCGCRQQDHVVDGHSPAVRRSSVYSARLR